MLGLGSSIGDSGDRERHEGQAPQVDSATRVLNCQAEPGDFVEVSCVERDNYDLVARPTQVALPLCQPRP